MEQATTELYCSGCKCTHPVSAFGVNRSRKSGHQSVCRASMAKYNRSERHRTACVNYDRSERGRMVIAEYRRSEHGRAVRNKAAANHRANLDERAWAIIGKTCAWSDLGGCSDLMVKDHTVPVKRRRTAGYTSYGSNLNQWIVDNPEEAKKRLQGLCERHNNFKADMPEDEARSKWMSRYPLLQIAG